MTGMVVGDNTNGSFNRPAGCQVNELTVPNMDTSNFIWLPLMTIVSTGEQ
jgi:hypothetical protein